MNKIKKYNILTTGKSQIIETIMSQGEKTDDAKLKIIKKPFDLNIPEVKEEKRMNT